MAKTETAIARKWAFDPAHSKILFKVRHLVISTVTGEFNKFDGEVHTDGEDFDNAKVTFTIDVDSISTNSEDRDNHLKSDDFFAADKYPEIKFRNGKLHKIAGNEYKLKGDLSIRGTTKAIELDVVHHGTVQDPWGNTKAGFEVTGKLDRKAYGLTWNTITEAGSVLVGEEVKIDINVQIMPAADA